MSNLTTITKKTNKQVIIDYIVSCLKKGEARGNIVSKVGRKWQKEPRTVDRMIKIAKQQHSVEQQAIQKELADIEKRAAVDGLKKGLKSVLEIDLKVQEIIFNNFQMVKDGNRIIKVENTTADKLKAIDLYYKRHGYFAPDKVAQTDTEGNNIEKPYSRAEILDFLNQANG